MFIINLIIGFILTALIIGIIKLIPKIPIHIRISISIIFIIVIFLTLKELTGVSSFWDIFNFNFLKNLK